MWMLAVVIMVMSPTGALQRQSFTANESFVSREACMERGAQALREFSETAGVIGGTIVCMDPETARQIQRSESPAPRPRGEYEA